MAVVGETVRGRGAAGVRARPGGGVAEEGGPSSAPSSRRSRNARLHLHGDVARELAAAGNPEIRAEVADLDDVRVLATVVLAA